ncbi:MAG TPA: hypothetical protein VGN86_18170 [Pyrinomonadaceae bacterium]|nr:hypothetical protein [Pyrinomonadaceae bacterium]
MLLLLYVFWGTLVFPGWWYSTLFEGGYRNLGNLRDGVLYVIGAYYLIVLQTVVIIVVITALSRTGAPRKLSSVFSDLWNTRTVSWASLSLGIILLLGIVISVGRLESRTREQREVDRKFEETQKKLQESLAQFDDIEERSKRIPLSVPTSFIYLDKDSTESLFGQYEPELVPAIMQEEIEHSTELSGGIQSSFISTDAGQKELNKKVTEYRSTPKNSERKLKDLIRYLNEKALLPMFRDIQPKTEELIKLNEATELLSKKYELGLDAQKLKVVRDRLLSDELRVVKNQLRDLHGLALVEGDWSVEIQPTAYVFRHSFVSGITDSPVCEVKLKKTDIGAQYKEAIESSREKTLRFSIFGNVLVGLSEGSKTVSLSSIAVF